MADTRWWVFGLLTLLVLVGMATAVSGSVAGPTETVGDGTTVSDTAGDVDQSGGVSSVNLAAAEPISSSSADGEADDSPELITADHEASTGTVEPTQEAPFFEVEILDTSEAIVGEDLQVTVNVTNTGDQSDSQTVNLNVPGLGSDDSIQALAGGVSTETILTVPTDEGDKGNYTATVQSDDDQDSAPATVYGQPQFDVAVENVTTPTAGDPLELTVNVTNTGEGPDTQSLEVSAPDLGTNSTDVSLGVNGSTTETLWLPTNEDDVGNHTVNVTTADDETTVNATVIKPPFFDIQIVESPPVAEGNQFNVTINVTNTGDVAGTRTVDLEFAVLGNDSEELTLDVGENTTTTLSVQTEVGDNGTHGAGLFVRGDLRASEEITILRRANFEVTALSVPDVGAGDPVVATIGVENTGEATATKSVDLVVDSLGSNSTDATLSENEFVQVNLSVPTTASDTGTYNVTASTEDDEMSTQLSVLEPAFFDVTIQEATGGVEGSPISVSIEVENTGGINDSQQVGVETDLGTNETTVSLDAGESTNRTLTVPTESGDAGTSEVNVSSEDDSENATVTVLQPATFEVETLDTNKPVAGEEATVTVEITNVGDVEGTQTLAFDLSGLATETRNVTLGPGVPTNETFSVQTGAGDAGSHTASVASDDDQDEANLTVLEPPHFEVSILGTEGTVAGGQANVTAEIANVGDVKGTQPLAFDLPGLANETRNVTIGPGASTNETFTVQTGAGDAGTYATTVSSEDDQAQANVTVLAPAFFDVTIQEAAGGVEGSPITVTVGIENTGGINDSQQVGVETDLGTNDTTVSLDAGDSTTRTLTVQTGSGDAGTYDANVSSEDDQDEANVTVLVPAAFGVSVESATTPVQGAPLEVTVNVTNAGEVTETQPVELSVGSLGTDDSNVTLDAGENRNETLSVPTGPGEYGDFTASVTVDGTPVTEQTVEVKLPPLAGSRSPQDQDDDGLYEDIRGDNSVGVFDVQTLFENMDADAAQDNAGAYNFQGSSPDKVAIFDVQALFGMT